MGVLTMRLAIADPPYLGRSTRWYGDGRGHAAGRGRADHHADAVLWDDPQTHRDLMHKLVREYDGWALAGNLDSLGIYLRSAELLGVAVHVGVWHRGNAIPSGARVATQWEPVLFAVPESRAAHGAGLAVSDVLSAGIDNRAGFVGSKPPRWTRWVLDVLGYDPAADMLDDLFPGSGAVAAAADGMLALATHSEGRES